jgi:hypothetical protein
MLHEKEFILDSLRYVLVVVVMIASLLVLWFMITTFGGDSTQSGAGSSTSSILDTDMSGSPNVVSKAFAAASFEVSQAMQSTGVAMRKVSRPVQLPHIRMTAPQFSTSIGHVAGSTVHGIGSGFAFVGHGIGNGFAYIGRGIGNGFAFVGRGMWGGAMFVFHIPGKTIGAITRAPVVSAFVKPGEDSQVPIIDPDSPALLAAQTALPATPTPAQPAAQATQAVAPQWPIHGAITTEFGVPEPPYQPIHTGLDISDGKRRGTTPIHPFRPGRVIEKVSEKRHLGNHVTIDHGNGVTSVYGHLNSISVHIGDVVDENSVLGYEGTTGVSTGVHLHFEIRVNGQAANPHKFIAGHP